MRKRMLTADYYPQTAQALGRLLPSLILLGCIVNLVCILIGISNTTPLSFLTACALLAFFTPDRPRLSWFAALPVLFVLYLYLHNIIFFPDVTSFPFRRRAFCAFAAGIALYYALRNTRLHHFYLLNLCAPFVYGAIALLAWAGFVPVEKLFWHGRLKLLCSHPITLSFVLGGCIVSAINALMAEPAQILPPGSPLARYAAVLYPPRWLPVVCICANLAILFATLSRAALFAMLFVSGCMVTARLFKRYGSKRTIGLLGCVAALFAAFVLFEPLKGHIDDTVHTRMIESFKAPWKDNTFQTRIPLWTIAVTATLEDPLLGKGPEKYTDWYQIYVREHYDELVARFGKEIVDSDTLRVHTPHNEFLMLSTDYGIFAAALFFAMMAIPIVYALKHKTGFGEMVPILVYFFIYFFFDHTVNGYRNGYFGTTVIFMIFGYFACLLGTRSRPSAPGAGPKRIRS